MDPSHMSTYSYAKLLLEKCFWFYGIYGNIQTCKLLLLIFKFHGKISLGMNAANY